MPQPPIGDDAISSLVVHPPLQPPPPWAVAVAVCAHLPPREKYRLATLFRLHSVQAAALAAALPESLAVAALRGDLDHLRFRLRHHPASSPTFSTPPSSSSSLTDGIHSDDAHDAPAPATPPQLPPHPPPAAFVVPLPWHTVVPAASRAGHVHVLEWWAAHGPAPAPHAAVLWYTAAAMDGASERGHVAVLQWWASTCGGRNPWWPVRYTAAAMDLASTCGHVAVLAWWVRSGLRLEYTAAAMDGASARGQVGALGWWRGSGLALRYTHDAMDGASAAGHTAVLQWWLESRLELRFSEAALEDAAAARHALVLRWWEVSGLWVKHGIAAQAVADYSRAV
ncbi:hypothetical protein DFJ73DRAFT_662309 [Zopfochytrium polystomum]|nr:hypothetical protein DFJ73DRAFT_662309 [Zopfochytrium polystomum]